MSNTCKNFQNPKIGKKMIKYGNPPIFSLEIFFTKMTQNGLKWMENSILFYSFFLKASLIQNKFHSFTNIDIFCTGPASSCKQYRSLPPSARFLKPGKVDKNLHKQKEPLDQQELSFPNLLIFFLVPNA